jgi:hypothetical protein
MASTRLNPLLRWARARQGAVEQPDFGDHGTAFGMELSMDPAPTAAHGASRSAPQDPAAPAASSPPAPEVKLHDGTMGMWRRMSGRRAWRDG